MRKWQMCAVTAVAFGVGLVLARSGSATGSREAAEVAPMANATTMIGRLKSTDLKERVDARKELVTFHRQLTAGLLGLAAVESGRLERSENSRHLAVGLLQKFYCPQAIPLLVKYVDYEQPMTVDEVSPINGYPCALALRDFGQQSTAAILEHLFSTRKEEISSKANELYAWLFLEIYGPPIGSVAGGPKEAVAVIERARDRFGERGKENCQLLLDAVKHFAKDSLEVQATFERETAAKKVAQELFERSAAKNSSE